MGYVVPNSTIQLFKGVSLDNRYLHTIYFANETAQNGWFSGKVYKTYNEMMYRRQGSDAVKIEADATELLGVTYMRFKNTRSGNKWFYCFVNYIDYVNENTAVVYYEIDVMQTWFIQNGTLKPCMVKREHVINDTFGNNLEREPVGSTEYNSTEIKTGADFSEYWLVVSTTGEPDDAELIKQGIFDGTKQFVAPVDTPAACKQWLIDTLGSWDAYERQQEVINMTQMPKEIAEQGDTVVPHDININMPSTFTGYNGESYTPKNKKLFMYPYSYLQCTTKDGDGGIYRWEYFPHGLLINFRWFGTMLGGGQAKCYPLNYNGIHENIDSGVSISDFPKCAFNFDAFEAWVAAGGRTKWREEAAITRLRGAVAVENTFADTVSISGGSVREANTKYASKHGELVGVDIGAKAVRAATNIADTYLDLREAFNKVDYKFRDAVYQPNQMVGQSVPTLSVGAGYLNFYFQHTHVKINEAKRIDDFFSCYGYAINEVKVPNIRGRQYWNFVQTENCCIGGDMPSSSRAAIEKIFDGGITFWHNGNEIGNYMQSFTEGTINNPII